MSARSRRPSEGTQAEFFFSLTLSCPSQGWLDGQPRGLANRHSLEAERSHGLIRTSWPSRVRHAGLA